MKLAAAMANPLPRRFVVVIMKKFNYLALGAASVLIAIGLQSVQAGTSTEKTNTASDQPEFTDAFMSDAGNIAAGGELWKQCRHCHGRNAYPGKAPKLKPRKYKPAFVYKRITNGFRKMPPWKEVFTQEQRMQLVAYIKSKQFSP